MSSRKGRRLEPSANHLKSDAVLLVTKVTPYSLWFDSWWYEDNSLGGGKSLQINWFKGFSTDELRDPRCRALIDAARRVIWAMRYPVLAKSRSTRSIYRGKARRLLDLVAWMYRNAVWTFADLTAEIVDWYKSDLLEAGPAAIEADEEEEQEASDLELQNDRDNKSVSKLSVRLRILVDIFELSQEFENFPEFRLPAHPFRGQSVTSLAESLAISSDGWIPRIPDEVFNPLMQATLDWIDVYSKDVLFAQGEYLRVMDSRRTYTGHNYGEFVDAALLDVRFDSCGRLPHQWRPPLLPTVARRDEGSSLSDQTRGPTHQLRDLIEDLEAAGLASVQAITGVRISELLHAKAEPRQPNGWPACLVQRTSRTGLYDLFYFSSHTFKGEKDDQGTPFEWLLGVRPAGTLFLPIAVRGILTLDKLFMPWRDRFRCDYLVMSLGKGGGLPHSAPVHMKPLTDRHARILKHFVRKQVEIPEEFVDWNVTSHQFRKTFCQDIVRINPRALPAVQEHYGHASAYITDEAYTGNDATMLKLIDDVATREAAKIMLDRVYGNLPLGGKLADVIDAREAVIRELLEGIETYERRLSALANALSVEGIMIFTSDYLDCLFRPEHAMCHYDLHGYFDKSATRPLRAYRTRKNCSVCQNGVINSNHIPYWEKEYRSNEHVRRANDAIGDFRTAAVAASRAAQARSVLRKFGTWPIHDAN
ncbi:hypothetical protein E0H47_24145 [Rhizobium leguminosarum bv. viciae]|uniref:hypothetical protein n=1 Tax=Rhizobium leguminosarum TaxID=384 RepID=UPI00103BC9A4|nr:hypothetical protein [Rhizobium leguminosarum]TBZ35726.1 hypothetical protein E0H47_24145 [Rhizobium leguminosarum bv. viciae]